MELLIVFVLLVYAALMILGASFIIDSNKRERGFAIVISILGLSIQLLLAECCKNKTTGKYSGRGKFWIIIWLINFIPFFLRIGYVMVEYIKQLH